MSAYDMPFYPTDDEDLDGQQSHIGTIITINCPFAVI